MRLVLVVLSLLLVACDARNTSQASDDPRGDDNPGGVPVEPPFAVRDDLSGLVLTYFDAEGAHTARSLDDVPQSRRSHVRVDSLELPPEHRDPEHVYVADLRAMDAGRYPVHRYPRAAFDALVDRLTGHTTPEADTPVAAAQAPVVVYGASWCGACRSVKQWLQARGVPYEDKDIERDPGARTEMLTKARAQGVPTGSIPIIDVRGRMTTGFDAQTLTRLLAETERRTL
ncbi:MAG: hypothetical protein KF901_24410 [Myxococcales bacterium]|nr:hypothetical protein [Myxococcales bacterium]